MNSFQITCYIPSSRLQRPCRDWISLTGCLLSTPTGHLSVCQHCPVVQSFVACARAIKRDTVTPVSHIARNNTAEFRVFYSHNSRFFCADVIVCGLILFVVTERWIRKHALDGVNNCSYSQGYHYRRLIGYRKAVLR